MRFGDIYIEALRMLYANADEFLDISGLEDYRLDSGYSDLLQMMPGALNRALADLEGRGAVPDRRSVLEDGEQHGPFIRFMRPADCRIIRRVSLCGERRHTAAANYHTEGDTILVFVPPGMEEAEVSIIYSPRVPRVTAETQDTDTVPIPEELAALLPYYLCADIDRQQEPQRARDARNYYEAGVLQYLANAEAGDQQTEVDDVWEDFYNDVD